MRKLKLKFVNEGKAFDVPLWTTKKHEAALDKLIKNSSGISEAEKNEEFKYYIIHESLLEVDPKCKIEDVRAMHPTDTIELFNVLYNAGRTGIWDDEDFQKEEIKTSEKK